MTVMSTTHQIQVRSQLDFRLNEVPKYWFRNDPYATRFLDSISVAFPEGERFFISSLRPFRSKIEDPKLAQEVANFSKQEGQHGIQHSLYNDVLIRQGVPVRAILEDFDGLLNNLRTNFPPIVHLAFTAALEHMTALMAEALFGDENVMAGVHPNMRALLAWHAIEEMEHRAVAFDVLTQVAKMDYKMRTAIMARVFIKFWTNILRYTDIMLKADGFSRIERLNMARKTLPLFFGQKGCFTRMAKPFFQYYRQDFHPNDIPVLKQYPQWLAEFEISGDPIKASERMYQ